MPHKSSSSSSQRSQQSKTQPPSRRSLTRLSAPDQSSGGGGGVVSHKSRTKTSPRIVVQKEVQQTGQKKLKQQKIVPDIMGKYTLVLPRGIEYKEIDISSRGNKPNIIILDTVNNRKLIEEANGEVLKTIRPLGPIGGLLITPLDRLMKSLEGISLINPNL